MCCLHVLNRSTEFSYTNRYTVLQPVPLLLRCKLGRLLMLSPPSAIRSSLRSTVVLLRLCSGNRNTSTTLRNRTRACLGGGGRFSESLATPEVSSGPRPTATRSGQMRRTSDLQRQHVIIFTNPQVVVKHTEHPDQTAQPFASASSIVTRSAQLSPQLVQV